MSRWKKVLERLDKSKDEIDSFAEGMRRLRHEQQLYGNPVQTPSDKQGRSMRGLAMDEYDLNPELGKKIIRNQKTNFEDGAPYRDYPILNKYDNPDDRIRDIVDYGKAHDELGKSKVDDSMDLYEKIRNIKNKLIQRD